MPTNQSAPERRYLPFEGWDLREDDKQPRLAGYAAVFNQETRIAGLWNEKVAPGAFKKTIREADVRALWNHDTNIVLGRNKAKTLTLGEDDHGLKVEILPPDTQWGRDAVISIKRGDVSQMSIAFRIVKQLWEWPEDRTELPRRTILEAQLFEVSPVTFPAFEQTEIQARSGLYLPDGEPDVLEEARRLVRCAERGAVLTPEQRHLVRAARGILSSYLPAAEPASDHSAEHRGDEPEAVSLHSAEWRARELELLSQTL